MTTNTGPESVYNPQELGARLERAAEQLARVDAYALLVTPGPDLRYLAGYDAHALERLTCLIVRADGPVQLVVPELERQSAQASSVGELDIEVVQWAELEDPYTLVNRLLSENKGPARVALDDHMWAAKVLALRTAMPGVDQVAAGAVLRELRMRKTPAEIAALQHAGAAIDAVHAQMPELLRIGRTENEVGKDIAAAIGLEHVSVDFVIVGSGPNGASPHHSCSERELRAGDVVVVDIGGTTADGYCSDSTRTYAMGDPDPQFLAEYAVLQQAQQAARDAVKPGVTCEQLDAVARDILRDAGLGKLFIHRTGHGIGLETHEEPYIVSGNSTPLEPGMAFSIEPGFYREGQWGARIEDIVVCTEAGALLCNNQPRDLVVIR